MKEKYNLRERKKGGKEKGNRKLRRNVRRKN